MIVSQWFERVGSVLAPDENYTYEEEDGFIPFAPLDVNGDTRKTPPPPNAFPESSSAPGLVQCEHCLQMTRTDFKASTPSSKTTVSFPRPVAGVDGAPIFTSGNTIVDEQRVCELVIETALDLAKTYALPRNVRSNEILLFEKAVSSSKIKEKSLAQIRNDLLSNPSLLDIVSTQAGNNPPPGYSLLMACAQSNNVAVANILLEVSRQTSSDIRKMLIRRNLQGDTALHVAARQGHVEMTDFLRPLYTEESAADQTPDGTPGPKARDQAATSMPVNLTGSTPLGAMLTSPNPKAQKERNAMNERLYSKQDVSFLGSPQPQEQRTFSVRELNLAWAFREMPGVRVHSEDCVLTQVISLPTKYGDAVQNAALFAVCDGHADGGLVSQFVTEQLARTLQQTDPTKSWSERFEDVCVEVDDAVKTRGLTGGSTAIIALVTADEIVVANVGDCRAILIRKQMGEVQEVTEGVDKMTLQENADEQQKAPSLKAVALSNDHKPDEAVEKTRIKAAGMKVQEEAFMENGLTVSISKVVCGESKLATSRSFGDFEFKTKKSPDKHAVIAMPEVMVRRRTASDSFLVLACDGIWDVISNDDAGAFIDMKTAGGADPPSSLTSVVDDLLDMCLQRGSTDNMSAIVVDLACADFLPSRTKLFAD